MLLGRARSRFNTAAWTATCRSPSTGSSATSTRSPSSASDGTIDWYCCPAFDSPSVFASILDKERAATTGSRPWRRTGPRSSSTSPDTNVLITRFFTPDGVGELQGLHADRANGEERHRHRLIRRVVASAARCASGSSAAALQLRPRRARDRAARARGRLPLAEPLLSRSRRRRRSPATTRRAQRVHPELARERHLRPRAGRARLRPARVLGGGDARGLRAHDRVLAPLALAVPLPGPLARDGAPLGAHAEAPHLPADRARSSPPRRRASPSRSAASATGTTATPGSATPRSRSTRSCASASRRRPRPSWSGSPTASACAPTASRAAPDHVRIDGRHELRRGDARPPRGLPRLERRCGSATAPRPAPARHLRRADRLGLPLQQVRRADLPRRLGRPLRHRRLDLRELGPAGRGDLGDAGGGRTSRSRGCMCWVAIERATRIAASAASPPTSSAGWSAATTSTQIMERGWNEERAPSSSTTTRTSSTPRSCSCRS